MFSMAPIIGLYLKALFRLVRPTHFSTFQMNATLPSAFRRTVLVHSGGAKRRVGPLSFSTTTSLRIYVSRRSIVFTLPRSRVQKALGLGFVLLATRSRTDSARDGCQGLQRDQPFIIFAARLSHPGI